MHPLLVPAMLLLASLSQNKKEGPRPLSPPGGAPKPRQPRAQAQRRPAATDRPMPAAQAQPAKPKVQIKHEPEHPDVLPAAPEDRAAVDAAMADMIKRLEQQQLPQPTGNATIRNQNVPVPADQLRDPFASRPAVVAEPEPPSPVMTLTEMEQKQRAAAQKLLAFLIKTGRFGTLAHDKKSKRDRPAEIIEAQRVLRVTPDGIVGPKTRAAAAAVGVALPERPK